MRLVDRDMEEKYGKIRYSSLILVQEVLFCFINIFLSFPNFSKILFLHLLHSNEDHEPTLVYPSLQNVNIPSPHIDDYDQDPLSESYDNLEQPCKFYEIKDDIPSFVPILVSSKIQLRYNL